MVAANQTPRWDPATAGVMEDSGTEGHPLAALHWSGCLSYDLSLSFKSGVTYRTSTYCILTECIDTHTNCTFIYNYQYILSKCSVGYGAFLYLLHLWRYFRTTCITTLPFVFALCARPVNLLCVSVLDLGLGPGLLVDLGSTHGPTKVSKFGGNPSRFLKIPT